MVKAIAYILLAALCLGGCTPVTSEPRATPAATATASNSEVLLRIGTAITQPFEFHDADTNELVGLDVDIADYIAGQLDAEIVWVQMPFASLLPSLQESRVDMVIAGMYITDQRSDLVDFSDPYASTGLVMVVRPDLPTKITSKEDLAGLRVGVKIGATGAALAEQLVQEGTALEIVAYKETVDSLLDLEVGRLDVVLNDYINTLFYLKESRSSLIIVGDESNNILFLSQASIGIAVQKGNHELRDKINKALQDMNFDGTAEALYRKWLIPAD